MLFTTCLVNTIGYLTIMFTLSVLYIIFPLWFFKVVFVLGMFKVTVQYIVAIYDHSKHYDTPIIENVYKYLSYMNFCKKMKNPKFAKQYENLL